jgi:hypothetical protein
MTEPLPNPGKRIVPPIPPVQRRNKLIFWILLGIPILLFCTFAVWRIRLGHEINTRIAKIHAAGLPASGEELNNWLPKVPDNENGAPSFQRAFGLIWMFPDARSNKVGNLLFFGRTNQWTSETRAMNEEYVERNEAALSAAHEAVKFSKFRFDVDYSYGPVTQLPYLSKIRNLARIAALRQVLAAENNHPNGWPPYVQDQLRFAAALEGDPAYSGQINRGGMLNLAVKATERCLNRNLPDDDDCAKLQAAFVAAASTNTLPLSLIGERAITIPVFRMSRAEMAATENMDEEGNTVHHPPPRYSGKPSSALWVSGLYERDLNFYLQTMDHAISIAALPLPDRLKNMDIDGPAQAEAKHRDYIISSLLLPSFRGAARISAKSQAQLDLAVTALAVERFHSAKGHLPGELNELAPKFLPVIPADPFDGAPLRYHLLEHGYVIYSIGEDGHDDGGREPPERRKDNDKSTYDITFVVQRP